MESDLFVNCPNESCSLHSRPIWLRISNPQRILGDPSLWPKDGTKLFLECPSCRRVSAHSRVEIGVPPELNRSEQMVWLRISFRCATRGCGFPVEFHVWRETKILGLTKAGIYEQLRGESWEGESPCGHPMHIKQKQLVHFSLDGIVNGYDPHTDQWRHIPGIPDPQ